MKKRKSENSLILTLKVTRNLLISANKIVPGVSVILTLLFIAFLLTATLSVKLMMGSIIIIVVCTSLSIYLYSNKYGEAALALVAGLLAAFTVEWTKGNFIAFSVAWFFFSISAFMISSIRLAAKTEDIYKQAAVTISNSKLTIKEAEKILREIGANAAKEKLGPVERAEILRFLAFRNLPINVYKPALETIGTLSVVTRVNYKDIIVFIADIYTMINYTPNISYSQITDIIFNTIRETPVPPEDFITAFKKSRQIVLSNNISLEDYFKELKNALNSGISPENIYEYLSSRKQE